MKQTGLALVVLFLAVGAGAEGLTSARDGPLERRSLPGAASEILPVEAAFRFGAYPESGGIKVFWQVMPGYFLYRDKFAFARAGRELRLPLPRGRLWMDEIFGEVEVLDGLVEVLIPDTGPGQALTVAYQGCARQGYCYPPQQLVLNASDLKSLP